MHSKGNLVEIDGDMYIIESVDPLILVDIDHI